MNFPIINPSEKTVKIPLSYKNGELKFFYNENISLNDLVEESPIVELIVPAFCARNSYIEEMLNKDFTVSLLPKETMLFCQIKVNYNEGDKLTEAELQKQKIAPNKIFFYWKDYFVPVILLEELRLKYRGMKAAQLNSCKIAIPIINKEAKSLNHAYTLISQEYQKQRIAHTGNVFTKFFIKGETEGLDSLEKLRVLRSKELNKKVAEELKDIVEDTKANLFE